MTQRWYMVNTIGMATLCRDELDAKQVASEADIAYPRHAPHRAVQLVEAPAELIRDRDTWMARANDLDAQLFDVVAERDRECAARRQTQEQLERTQVERNRSGIEARREVAQQMRVMAGEARVLRRLLAEARDVLGTIDPEDAPDEMDKFLAAIDAALDPTSRDCQQLCIAAEPPAGAPTVTDDKRNASPG